MHRDVWEAVPYGNIGNVCITIVGDGFLHVPKRYLYININSAYNLFLTTRIIINSEISVPWYSTQPLTAPAITPLMMYF